MSAANDVESVPAPASRPGEEGVGVRCFHCGTPCPKGAPAREDRTFCCHGCQTVHELLVANGLGHFYDLGTQAGLRVGERVGEGRFTYLDDAVVRERLVDFSDGHTTRVTFQIPAMHCVACVWLLENLFRLGPGIGRSQVNFPRREVTITFDETVLKLSGVVTLLHSLGYPPTLRLDAVEREGQRPSSRRLYLQVGVAGFAFGNAMLFSFPGYLGLEGAGSIGMRGFFGVLSLLLAVPVMVFSAADYWRAAWTALRRRVLTIDFPIAIGLAALFGQSAFEILTGAGEGYVDSLTGLVFFLLCGRVFQRKSYERLAFDRDYRAFFPLAVTRRQGAREEMVAVSRLAVGDRLLLRHGEIVPADARLVGGEGLMDYSFVTGEADPVEKAVGATLYAGGQQVGGAIEVETLKPVSQSYLASLWSNETFVRPRAARLDDLTNRFSRWFTLVVVGVALGAATWWGLRDASLALRAFTAVLIVACPCALALAAPFTFGTAQRLLGRAGIFLKRPQTIETLARVDSVVFDKTGTLTLPGRGAVKWEGRTLTATERSLAAALAGQSTHPLAVRVRRTLGRVAGDAAVAGFCDEPGGGMKGTVDGRPVVLGSARWLRRQGLSLDESGASNGSAVWLGIDGECLGAFRVTHTMRPETPEIVARLGASAELALVSGDNARERDQFVAVFGLATPMRFSQSPLDKLEFVRARQEAGRTVMMVGDGLNDAGALRCSDVGVAVVEDLGTFSPASEMILEAGRLGRLPAVRDFARGAVRIVHVCIGVSCLYNLVGVSLAARGLLAPWICAILMPLSSVSVVALASGLTAGLARRLGFLRDAAGRDAGEFPEVMA
ncbi:MAG: heavy metal translocating P-type ATPase metal-binding domain-containing protein [Verrucomicrobiales bacterium]|nr:heavy metal translocating P-type ATPase metal-binding domain-containing protein [Verrucomicrobiales bacterium]